MGVEEAWEDDDNKGECHSRPLTPAPATLSFTLPPGWVLPEGPEPTIVEITLDCRESIRRLLESFGLSGRDRVTEQTRLNMLVCKEWLLGFSTLTPLEHDRSGQEKVRLDWIYVDSSCRGDGHANRLWDHALAQYPDATVVGNITDPSGAMRHMAEKRGAVPTRWEIRRNPTPGSMPNR